MSKIVTTIAVLSLAFAGSAFAQDYRSPDAHPALVQQDYRSPDAQQVSSEPSTTVSQDLRSPDARATGAFQPAAADQGKHSSSSTSWAYLAIALVVPLLLIAAFVLTLRRGRRGVAVGS